MKTLASRAVRVDAGTATLDGDLTLPHGARAVVLFAHGSGSGRLSPRNRFVAEALNRAGLGTLLLDLLTAEEEASEDSDGALRFDIPFLADRLRAAMGFLRAEKSTRGLALGLFGASTGAAAALVAAAGDPGVYAVVSRGGRPDLAADALARVKAPTLLVVGGLDGVVVGLNRDAHARLRCEKRLEIVPGATHLFEEAGALEEVARLAADWFVSRLPARSL